MSQLNIRLSLLFVSCFKVVLNFIHMFVMVTRRSGTVCVKLFRFVPEYHEWSHTTKLKSLSERFDVKHLFEPKPWSFPKPNQVVFVPKPNQTLTAALSHHRLIYFYLLWLWQTQTNEVFLLTVASDWKTLLWTQKLLLFILEDMLHDS